MSYAPLALLNDTRRSTARKHRVGQRCATGYGYTRCLEVGVIEQGVDRIKSLLLGCRGSGVWEWLLVNKTGVKDGC